MTDSGHQVDAVALDTDDTSGDASLDAHPNSALPGVALAGLFSLGAGAVHAAAAGIHAEHPTLARLFVLVAATQIAAGLVALLRPTRFAASALLAINVGAVAAWSTTRFTGVSWVAGLETKEAPQFADTACASLGAASVAVALGAMLGWSWTSRLTLTLPSVAVAALAVPAMMLGVTHVHAEGDHHGDHGTVAADADDHAADDHGHDGDESVADASAVADDASGATDDDHGHDDAAAHDDGETHDDTAGHDAHDDDHDTSAEPAEGFRVWPRPWDPAGTLDLADVEGVTPEQQARAETLVEDSLRELPKYADPADAIADGYASIGDAGTGSEHYIKGSLVEDDVLLDATAPESLVYAVDGDQRTLAGAMYIASQRPADDPTLTEYAGSLMTWHKHDNLCWDRGADGENKVVGLIDADGNCARGVRAGGANPMVHVWITPHECGVFAALEGVGAGTAAVSEEERVDKCQPDHGDHADMDEAPVPEARAYDPTLPIDLSGTPGVTPQQQAAAENLIAITVVDLPQWSDYRVAEAAGFRTIGDGRSGHEHFVQWDWINDDTILDPDFPESLVYAPQPDGSKQLVSAMYMLPDDVGLDEVPDIGGALMQWHIHDNLCFTSDPEQPRVGGTTAPDGTCPAGLTKFKPAAMIHVWITPHECGPFAALEGVGAGQILDGEERLCDHAHGS